MVGYLLNLTYYYYSSAAAAVAAVYADAAVYTVFVPSSSGGS